LQYQHWGVDIGAEEVAVNLANRFASPVLIARVSRLLIDYNRPLSSDTLIRTHCDGIPVDFNQHLTEGWLVCSVKLTLCKEKFKKG
jgi:predicted N-formylglutamate amidohydrolase